TNEPIAGSQEWEWTSFASPRMQLQMATEPFESSSTDYGFLHPQNTARPIMSVDQLIAGLQTSTSVPSARTILPFLGPRYMIYDANGSIQFRNTSRTNISANGPTTSTQVSISMASLIPILQTNLEQFGLISTAIDPPPAGFGGSARAAIVVPVDGGHPRNQQALRASVSAAANQATAGLSGGQPSMMEPATAVESSIDGDENVAPRQHAQYVCECTLLPTTKEGKLAFACTHPHCEEIIINENNAKAHRRTHDFSRPEFPCGGGCGNRSCSRSFTRVGDLDRHNEEARVDAKKYPCDECSRAFKRRHDLNRHCKTVGHRPADDGGRAAAAPPRSRYRRW
ncbi:hypothetical protein HK405_008697, partial [Cladochytrium tenue]